ncbi:MAG: NAD-dependent epimerase/dehydratase family protein [Micromonosporaceae bacterium]
MRVLVTGGLGFLGRAVAIELLAHGHEVDLLTRGNRPVPPPDGAKVVEADLLDRDAIRQVVREGQYEGVCHLAALTRVRDSFEQPLTYYDVNVGGTLNLLHALAETDPPAPVRLVYTSTNAVYGTREGRLTEDMEPHPESPYAASKLAAEHLIGYHAAAGALAAVTLRCFNIAGAVDGYGDNDPTRLIPNVLRAAAGKLPHLTVNGDGSAVREYVHVADVASACRLALEKATPGHDIYNIGTGEGLSINDIIEATERVTGRPVRVMNGPAKSEPHTLVADSSRAQQVLDWRPAKSSVGTIVEDAWSATRAIMLL